MKQLSEILKTNAEVKNLMEFITEILKERQLYTNALDVLVYNTACQLVTYNKLMRNYLKSKDTVSRNSDGTEKRNPTLMDMTQIAETIRKNCKALGISYESKAQGVTENDPLSQLLETMGDDD